MKTEQNTRDGPLGSLLYEARTLKNESILSVSQRIRIQPKFLEALEKNEYALFPGAAFAIGFLKSYALYLGLNADEMCDLLRRDFKGFNKEPNLHFPQVASEKMFPSKKITYMSLLILFLLYIAFSFELKRSPLPTQEQEIESSVIQPIVEQKKEKPYETYHQAVHTKFKALGKCWVEIRHKEKGVVFDKLLEIGEEFEINSSPDEKLTIGNAGGIEVIIDGKSSGPLGKNGEVISNIPLDSEHLFSHYVQTSIRR